MLCVVDACRDVCVALPPVEIVAVTDDRNRRTKNNDVVTARDYRKLCFFIRTRIMPISALLSRATTTRDLTARLAVT